MIHINENKGFLKVWWKWDDWEERKIRKDCLIDDINELIGRKENNKGLFKGWCKWDDRKKGKEERKNSPWIFIQENLT